MKAGKRGASAKHREPPGVSRVDALIQQRRKEANTITETQIPARGETDYYGEQFLGLPGNRIKEHDIDNAELKTDGVDGRVIKSNEVDTPHLKNNSVKRAQILNGEIIEEKIAGDAVTGGKLKSNPHGVNPLENPNVNDDSNRAVGGAHIRTKAIDYYHLADGSVGNRVLSVGLGGLSGSLPPSKIKGKIPKSKISGVNWDQVDNKPSLIKKNDLDREIAQLKKWANNKFSQRGHNHN